MGTTRLRRVIEIQAAIASSGPDRQSVLDTAAEAVLGVVDGDGALVELAEGDELVCRAASGSAASLLGLRRPLADTLTGNCIRGGRAVCVTDAGNDARVDRQACRQAGIGSLVVVPLVDRGASVGALTVTHAATHRFDDADVEVVAMVAEVVAGETAPTDPDEERLFATGRDALTLLPSRRGLGDYLTAILATLRTRGGAVAVVTADLDHFREFNARHGHLAGDTVLEVAGARLRTAVRTEDMVARVGGDRFVVVARLGRSQVVADRDADPFAIGDRVDPSGAPDAVADPDLVAAEVAALTGRVSSALQRPYAVEGRRLQVAATLGAATTTDPGESPDTLLARARADLDAHRSDVRSTAGVTADG
jgi:GGDEF domain-containing protein